MGNSETSFSEEQQFIMDAADDNKNQEESKKEEKLEDLDLQKIFPLLASQYPQSWNPD